MEAPIKITVKFNDDKSIAYIDGTFSEFNVTRNLVMTLKDYQALSLVVSIKNVINTFVHEIIKGVDNQTDAKLIIHKHLNEIDTEITKTIETLKEFENHV